MTRFYGMKFNAFKKKNKLSYYLYSLSGASAIGLLDTLLSTSKKSIKLLSLSHRG